LSKGSIWSYTRAREFSYNALQPGKYDLEIEYSIDNYRWYPASQEIIFSIAEPWWQNKILQLSIFCIVIAMVYFFLKNQIEVLKQRQKMMEANARFQEDLLRAEHAAMENERSRIAKDLHDGVGTALAVIKISIYSQLKDIVEKRVVLNEQLDVVIQDIREIIYDLAPHGIDRDGLRTSIENYIDRVKSKATYFQIDFRFSGEESVDLKIAISIFRIVQELITNTLKHSAATRISVIISSQKENLILTYRDNGIGLTLSKKKNGYGLGNIESRVSSMNGKIILLPSDSGVHYEITIPIYHNSMQRTS
jgi:signal transduction histidine kinase